MVFLLVNCQQYLSPRIILSYELFECINRNVLETPYHVAYQLQEYWQDCLPRMAAYINISINASTGKMTQYID